MKHNVAGPIADLAGPGDDVLSPRATRALFWRPRLLTNAPWTIHIPFAFWLIETCRPRRVVELGIGRGASYFAFCQAIDKLGIEARCTGIDHWGGDRFTQPDPEAGAAARAHNDQFYQEFSEVVTADLIGAEAGYPDESVDLLHVDVALTAPVVDSLLHDWAPKLSHRAMVLLHGTRSRCDAPEAADFLARIRGRHRCFESEDGEGLTLALIGSEQSERLVRIAALEPGSAEAGAARLIFRQLGRGHEFEAISRRDESRLAELRSDLARAEAEAAGLRGELDVHRAAIAAQTRRAAEAQARLFDCDGALADLGAALAAREAEAAEAAVFEAGLREAREALLGARRRITELEAETAAGTEALAARFAELATLGGLAERARADADAAEAARVAERDRAALAARETRKLKAALAAERTAQRKAEFEATAAQAARHKAAAAAAAELTAERNARRKLEQDLARVVAYGRELEKRHAALLASDTWRAMEPARKLARLVGRGRTPAAFKPRLDRLAPPAPAPAPAPAVSERGKAETQEQISRAFEKAKAAFREAGRAEIEMVRMRRRLDAASRRQAERALILLDAESPDAEVRAQALAALEAMPVWRGDARGPGEAATLRVALLEGLGRDAEAAPLAAAPPPEAAEHPDFLLLAAGLTPPGPGADAARVATVARAFWRASKLPLAPVDAAAPAGIDNLRGGKSLKPIKSALKISVIVPAYRCADTIATSLRSLTRQSWENLEILVADDASPDATPDIVAEMAAADPRIRLIRLETNGGAYAARNAALAAATGDLVTCQDADDWSHPERLRRQAEHLKARPYLVANVSHWARATPDLRFERRPFTGRVIHFNSSSIMFHRERVLERAGFWDSVRFGADTEFWHRLQALFGPAAVEELPELLAIGRIREGSLSRASASAYAGAKTGARRAYEQAWRRWHASAGPDDLRLAYPLESRPFGVPAILRTGRSTTGHFDAVLISDFRHVGGTTASNQQELVAQARAGLRTALVQIDRYDFNVTRGIHADIQALIDEGAVEQLVHGDEVTADLAVVRFPPIFNQRQDYLPVIRPRAVRVVVNQPPRRVAGEAPFWSIETCRANIAAYLGQEGAWVPIGPAVRDALAADDEAHHLSPEDWFNIIDVDAWRVARKGWAGEVPVIGRHGRDAPEKWLTRREDLLAAYPDDGSVRVRVMGGADVALRTIGARPANWEVLGFNAMPVKEFLAGIDFFVFFPHEGRIEAFGRTVIEAMASGALAILPRVFEPLFGPAAVYCAPAEVGGVVAGFYADRSAYRAQTSRAEAEVRARFGFEQHVARLRAAVAAPSPATSSPGVASAES